MKNSTQVGKPWMMETAWTYSYNPGACKEQLHWNACYQSTPQPWFKSYRHIILYCNITNNKNKWSEMLKMIQMSVSVMSRPWQVSNSITGSHVVSRLLVNVSIASLQWMRRHQQRQQRRRSTTDTATCSTYTQWLTCPVTPVVHTHSDSPVQSHL